MAEGLVKPEGGILDHPFEVGMKFRNRQGEYWVVSLLGGAMAIRYDDGSLLRTRVDLQARIWANIQLEARVELEKAKAAAARPSLRRRGGQ